MPFDFEETNLPGVILVRPKLFPDERGRFVEMFKQSDFANITTAPFVQVNYSQSKKNVLRGVHYQNPPRAQAKLVTATKGKVFDVAVDIRQGSPTYGQWIGVELNETEKAMLFIPEGFAHGFCALTDNAEIIYFCTVEYAPEHEGGIVWNDPTIAIDWPVKNPILADRDAAFPSLEEASNVFEYKAA